MIDPHFPKLITRRAAANLVAENGGPDDKNHIIDCNGAANVSQEYANEIWRLWPNAIFSADTK